MTAFKKVKESICQKKKNRIPQPDPLVHSLRVKHMPQMMDIKHAERCRNMDCSGKTYMVYQTQIISLRYQKENKLPGLPWLIYPAEQQIKNLSSEMLVEFPIQQNPFYILISSNKQKRTTRNGEDIYSFNKCNLFLC